MIKRRVGQMAIANRLKKLEAMQEIKEHIEVIVFSVEDDGKIWALIEKKELEFETMFEAENYLIGVPGVTKNTLIIIDDMAVASNDLYLPTDPIIYLLGLSEYRKKFVELILKPKEWLSLYIPLIQEILVESIKNPNMQLPGFDDPALQDLIQNYNSVSIEQLVERYKDQKWFRGKGR